MDILTHVPSGRLTQSRMTCIKDLVDSKLFRLPSCRAVLLPVFCKQIKDKLESKEEVSDLSFFGNIIFAWMVSLSICFQDDRIIR